MPTIAEALERYNEAINASIFANPDFAKASASGNFGNFIRSQASTQTAVAEGQTVFTKYGTSYTTALDYGTPPRAGGSLNDVLNSADATLKGIYEWLQYKKYGIEYDSQQQRQRLAVNIASKIAVKGSYKYRNKGKQTAIIETALDASLPVLLEQLELASVSSLDASIKQSINANPNI